MITNQIGPDEVRPAMEAGRAEAAIAGIVWERAHGRRKRVMVIADALAKAAWRTQVMLATTVPISQTPLMNEDTLFVLVDQALAADGIVSGARLDETRAAIEALVVGGVLVRDGEGFIAARPQA